MKITERSDSHKGDQIPIWQSQSALHEEEELDNSGYLQRRRERERLEKGKVGYSKVVRIISCNYARQP